MDNPVATINLDDEQRQAVESTAPVTLVLAGAGSGKTRVLTERVVHLISQGVAPSRIMVVTFTRRAAAELQARLKRRGVDISTMLVGTIHAVARKFVGDERTVLTQPQANRLLMRAARDLGYYNPKSRAWKHKLSRSKVDAALHTLYTTGSLPCNLDAHIGRLIAEYGSRLASGGATDYGGILINAAGKICWLDDWTCRSDARQLPRIATLRRIEHVLVDEVQDTDNLQHRFLGALCPPASLFMVGDVRQSIYRWRGAEPENAGGRAASTAPLQVRITYRCAPNIMDKANLLMAHDPYKPCRVPMMSSSKTVISTNDPPIHVLREQYDVDSLASGILYLITRLGIPARDVAILARRHASLEALEPLLRRMNIPTYRVGGEMLGVETSQRTMWSLLTAIDRPDLWMGVEDLMESLGVADEERAKAWSRARDDNTNFLEGWEYLDCESGGIAHFVAKHDPSDTIGTICQDWEDATGSQRTTDWWAEKFGNRTVRQTTHWLAMSDAQDWSTDGSDKVTLSTIHGAKGLEWPVVIVMDLNEGLLPKSDTDVDDDRRVLYVAMTRARERLILHSRPDDTEIGPHVWCGPPSRFLDEIFEEAAS